MLVLKPGEEEGRKAAEKQKRATAGVKSCVAERELLCWVGSTITNVSRDLLHATSSKTSWRRKDISRSFPVL